MPIKVDSAWPILGVFALAAVAGAAGVPDTVMAAALLLLFGVAVARQTAYGLAAFVLATPFLLGEHKTPYFLLEPVAVLAILLSAVAHRSWRPPPMPRAGTSLHTGAALLFVAAAIVALPLNLRDLLEDLWLIRSLDWPTMMVQGIPDISHLKYLERVLILALGAGLFVAASRPPIAAGAVAALGPLAAVVVALSAFGLLRFFGLIRTAGQYLTLSFWTWQHPDLRLTAVAWNPDYLAQFLVLAVPLALALGWDARPTWERTLGWLAAGAGTLALAFTFQRAAYLALLVAVVTLLILLPRVGAGGRAWRRMAVGAAVLLVLLGVTDAVLLHGRLAGRLGRFVDDPNRVRLWTVAARMALDHPFLGVGTGRYAFFFHEYASGDPRPFGPFWGTAHSTYLHVLAEQGVIGLASFVAFFGGVFWSALRRLRASTGTRGVLLCGVLAALAGWLVYGLVQFTFRVDAIVYLACVLAGIAMALSPPAPRPVISFRWAASAVAVGLVLLAVRTDAALRRPVSPGYEAGFYRWERQADGGPARWTRGRAATTARVQGRILELRLRAPIPGLAARPQVVRVRLNHGESAVVRLSETGWHSLDVPVAAKPGSHVLIELEVGYTFVPARVSPSRDTRTLGVMVGEVAWRDARPEGASAAPEPPPGRRAADSLHGWPWL